MEILEAQWGIFYTSISPIICLTEKGRVARFALPRCLQSFFSSSTPEGSPDTLTPTTPTPHHLQHRPQGGADRVVGRGFQSLNPNPPACVPWQDWHGRTAWHSWQYYKTKSGWERSHSISQPYSISEMWI